MLHFEIASYHPEKSSNASLLHKKPEWTFLRTKYLRVNKVISKKIKEKKLKKTYVRTY